MNNEVQALQIEALDAYLASGQSQAWMDGYLMGTRNGAAQERQHLLNRADQLNSFTKKLGDPPRSIDGYDYPAPLWKETKAA